MGREPNFSELRDAIRQGQAKIAQGLKTGQMRSDRQAEGQSHRPRLDPAHEMLGKKPTLTEKSALFERYQKPKARFRVSSLRKNLLPQVLFARVRPVLLGIGAILATAAVVIAVFWVGKALIGLKPSLPPGDEQVSQQPPDETPPPVEPRPVVEPTTPRVPRTPEPTPTPPPVVSPPTQTGNNVIVVQYITASRESELLPVRDFFAQNGIDTAIIRLGGGSYLVTRDRFENPNRTGTDGHAMLQRIRTVGKRYAVETGDRQFGAEPFQDAYGMLRQ
ncbi:MAG: hypothetical protein GXY41_05845 [Phycisphaerae bacterium]|nr:hypothetical protein [Phycisphaerae bacterium]